MAGFSALSSSHGPKHGRDGTDGNHGRDGEQGPPGAVGPCGPQGEMGVPGPQGERGSPGDIGLVGPRGEQGATGPVGPAGVDGAAPEAVLALLKQDPELAIYITVLVKGLVAQELAARSSLWARFLKVFR